MFHSGHNKLAESMMAFKSLQLANWEKAVFGCVTGIMYIEEK